MTSHITKGTSPKINPPAPVERVVRSFFKWTHRCWSYPTIPVQVFWNWIFASRPTSTLWPDRSIGPNVHLCNISNRTTLNNFNCLAQAILARALITHLCDNAHLLGCLSHQSSFMNGPCQRLLAIHMFLHLHCLECRNRMSVIRGADRHNIDLISELLKHFSKIIELAGVWKLSRLFIEGSSVDVT